MQNNHKIIFPETDHYFLLKDPDKGACIIANKAYTQGETIATNYTAIIDWVMDESSHFQCTYPMYWTEEHSCIAFGIINLINHSSNPNCKLSVDLETHTVSLVSIQNIQPNQELCIDYGPEHFPFKNGQVKIV